MIQQLDKRPNKLHDTSVPAYYMFNGGYNPITNILADSPQSHVVLLHTGQLRVSGRVAFPYEQHRAYRNAVEATVVPDPSGDTVTDNVPEFVDNVPTNAAPRRFALAPAPTAEHPPISPQIPPSSPSPFRVSPAPPTSPAPSRSAPASPSSPTSRATAS